MVFGVVGVDWVFFWVGLRVGWDFKVFWGWLGWDWGVWDWVGCGFSVFFGWFGCLGFIGVLGVVWGGRLVFSWGGFGVLGQWW